MKTNKRYARSEMMVIDMNTDNVDGPPIYTDPDDGVWPDDALGKGHSAWDE